MPGARKAKKGQTESGKNSEQKPTAMWDKPSLQEFDGRANTNAGNKGAEPGGRWSKAAYDGQSKVIGKIIVKDL